MKGKTMSYEVWQETLRESAQYPAPWVDVVRTEVRTSEPKEIARKETAYGQRTVTRITTETTTEPYVVFSCGHERRLMDFNATGKGRKRIRCWECKAEAKAARQAAQA